MTDTRRYVYFLYSEEQFKEKNKILAQAGKEFSAGTVVVNGARKKFTQMSTESSITRFIDTKIIAEGYQDSMTFTKPIIQNKKGN